MAQGNMRQSAANWMRGEEPSAAQSTATDGAKAFARDKRLYHAERDAMKRAEIAQACLTRFNDFRGRQARSCASATSQGCS
jgi:hypothetical protein